MSLQDFKNAEIWDQVSSKPDPFEATVWYATVVRHVMSLTDNEFIGHLAGDPSGTGVFPLWQGDADDIPPLALQAIQVMLQNRGYLCNIHNNTNGIWCTLVKRYSDFVPVSTT